MFDYDYHFQRFLSSFTKIKQENERESSAMDISRRFFIGIVNDIFQQELSDSETLAQIKALKDAFNVISTA
jgi:hypothetical protein